MSEGRRLFVYGSLLAGEPAHGLLEGALALGPARTAPGFALLDLGEYPALVREEGRGAVHGELYRVPEAQLPALDLYEDCPDLYLREAIPLEGGGEADAYLFRAAPGELEAPRIASGDWRRRRLGDG